MACCIRGYHVYKDTWDAATGEELACEREVYNTQDCYAVAMKKKAPLLAICHEKYLDYVRSF